MPQPPLRLFNGLTRQLETFAPIHAHEARVYTCGPTVYHYAHIGNMRAYVFADVLGRALTHAGYALTHVINITDVGHLTDDADAGEDKLERQAARERKSIWDIAAHYTEAFKADCAALNIRPPTRWTVATDYVPQMIAFAQKIAPQHCYELESGLYFDVTSVPDYGRLARAVTDAGVSRIDPVPGKRHPQDFAIWRRTPPGETRQMEWDSPWGKGAPGWHLECSVMSGQVLGLPFDIHTGGIDHREIHHPCEIAQNQAHEGTADSGANIWMHNNFLVERAGKMSKSSGEFLRLQTLIDRGYHPLAYRLLCLQAHYRSELEFSWEGLAAALTRLKRLVMAVGSLKAQQARDPSTNAVSNTIRDDMLVAFDRAIADDLNTPLVLANMDANMERSIANLGGNGRLEALQVIDSVLGLNLRTLTRKDLRIRPKAASITEDEIEATLAERKAARAARDFAKADALRDHLTAHGVEVMDGDLDMPWWEWRLA